MRILKSMRSSTYGEEEGRKKNKNRGLGWILKNCDDCFAIANTVVGQQGEWMKGGDCLAFV